MQPDKLINELVEGFEGFRPRCQPRRQLIGWLLVSLICTAGVMLLIGPFRSNFVAQLLSSPQFLLESILVLSVAGIAGYEAILRGLPDRNDYLGARSPGGATLIVLLIALAYSYLWPPFALAMAGKRPDCLVEGILYASFCFLGLLLLLRRLAPTNRRATAALIGIAAGAIPALLMNLGCMYIPHHNLLFHFSPLLIFGILGFLIGPLVLRDI